MSTTIIQTNNENSSVTLTLEKKQINHLIEALLFSSSVNIGAEWNEQDYNEMVDLAKSLKQACNNNIELEKICFYKEENYEDNWSQDVLKTFKKNIKTLQLSKA
jgi:hypothetical protein